MYKSAVGMECAWYTDNTMGYDKLHKASHEPLRNLIRQTNTRKVTQHIEDNKKIEYIDSIAGYKNYVER